MVFRNILATRSHQLTDLKTQFWFWLTPMWLGQGKPAEHWLADHL